MGSDGTCMVEPAKLIVAIDFGTTFSGFSYVHLGSTPKDPQQFLDGVEGFEEWPYQVKAGATPYCKTQTSLLYMQKGISRPVRYELKAWGWAAFHEHIKLLQASQNGELDGASFHYITNFKLALAGSNSYHGDSSTYRLPEGFTVQRVVGDFLRELSILVEKELQNKYGQHISKKDIQWCLTVPAIWDNKAKEQMKKCAEIAGLVSGPSNVHGEASAHPIMIVLEPEAASVYGQHFLRTTEKTHLRVGSKILIVDAGGGTVDLVFHEMVLSGSNGDQVKEICSGGSGALCGATFVDDAFYKFLARKISCYAKFIKEHPSAIMKIRRNWEDLKICFDGEPGPYELWLPAQLANYWEMHNREHGLHQRGYAYDDVKITLKEMKVIFDSAVNSILELIERQISQVKSQDVDALMVVGGFSGSPYLMNQIRRRFDGRVKRIIHPTHSGKAVVTGAVAFAGLGTIVTSRISRKTYGISCVRPFQRDRDPMPYYVLGDDGESYCDLCFHAFVRKGEEVAVNSGPKRSTYRPFQRCWGPGKDSLDLSVYSSTERKPRFVTDSEVVKECDYSFPIPCKADMAEEPCVEISLYFGLTSIEITAAPVNFTGEKEILPLITLDSDPNC